MTEEQNYKNHVRYFPLVHYFLTPIFTFNLIWQAVRLFQEPNWDRAENLLMAIAFIALSIAARIQALRAQDRVIRLEEALRYQKILRAELLEKAQGLTTAQIIALRFASDDELPVLIQRILNNELPTSKEIKMAIKNWRGDFLRV